MKYIPIALQDIYSKQTKSVCYLVKIISTENEIFGFSTLDAVLNFDDGFGEVQYVPTEELAPKNIQSVSDPDSDNTELEGWFSSVFEQKMLAGKFNSAEITIYRVCYTNLAAGFEIVSFGSVGEIQYAANKQSKRKIEFKDLMAKIKSKNNDLYSLTCRAQFGDNACKMPYVWFDGAISQIEDQFIRFRISGVSEVDHYFDLGVIEFMDGDNAGATLEIETWQSDGWLNLSFVTPYPVQIGDSVRIRKDCDKTFASCQAYGNVINMRAEHLTPVQDQAIMVPGAYVRSQNAL